MLTTNYKIKMLRNKRNTRLACWKLENITERNFEKIKISGETFCYGGSAMFPKGSCVEGLMLSWWSCGVVVKTSEEVDHWGAPLKDRLSLDVPLPPGCYEVCPMSVCHDVLPRHSPRHNGDGWPGTEIYAIVSQSESFLLGVVFLRYSVTAAESWLTHTYSMFMD